MKPTLAETVEFNHADPLPSLSTLAFPLLASPKLDGVRAIVRDGVVYSRKLIAIPNHHVQFLFGEECHGFDGELVVGNETDPDLFNRTSSAVMREEGEPDVIFRVFDFWDDDKRGYSERCRLNIGECPPETRIALVEQTEIRDAAALAEYEAKMVAAGYEGVMVRKPDAPYKHGRSTLREGYLLKIKRFADSEAEVVGVEELMRNGNEQTRDELGHAKRSSHKANLVPAGTMGALLVRDVKSGIHFSIGTGFDQAQRDRLWQDHVLADSVIGRVLTYTYQPVGVKEKPRFPSFKGWRAEGDRS